MLNTALKSTLVLTATALAAALALCGCEPASSAPGTTDTETAPEVIEGNTFDRDGVTLAIVLKAQTKKEAGHDWLDVFVSCGAPDGTKLFAAMEEQRKLGDWHLLAIGKDTPIGDVDASKLSDGNTRVRARFTRPDGTTTELAFVNFR